VRKVQEQFGIELKTEQDTFVLFEVQLINLNSVVSLYYHYRVVAQQFFLPRLGKPRTDFNEFELNYLLPVQIWTAYSKLKIRRFLGL